MTEFIIVFRETLEATLIVGIIYMVLIKNNLHHALKKVWVAMFAAIFASIGIALLVLQLKSSMGNNSSQALFEGIFIYLTAIFIYYVIFWLSKHISDTKELEQKTVQSLKISSWGVFFLVFFAILREGFETVIFLISSFSMHGSFSYLGFFLGIVFAIIIGYVIVIQGKKAPLKRLFQVTTLCLVFIASGMLAYGTHEIEEYLVKSKRIQETQIMRPWNILQPKEAINHDGFTFIYSYNDKKQKYIHILHDKGSIGVFLKGFLGYNSNPNYIEFLLWLASLLFGFTIWRRVYFSKQKSFITT
ncbi:iron permease FTR1 family protein [Candidatus Marinamargulisbacteria bacterium SCGC AG-333-B06]|nr:iron permease FTR1 family protein [Candidatus Marinamargulisbacteria bacterium SCGC AG-333-B06]